MSDVLIVGAGSAGSVLAERLSADPSRRVTVLESGPGPEDAGFRALTADATVLPVGPDSPVTQHYRSALTDHPPRVADLVRGHGVGGSGAVNGGYFRRPVPGDIDPLPGWSWPEIDEHSRALMARIPLGFARDFAPATAGFVAAARDCGYGWLPDLDLWPAVTGVGPVPLNIVDGARRGPGAALLIPAMHRPNLTVRTGVRVTGVRIARGRAVGVDAVGPDGPVAVGADRVVLAAGAIASAQLLMLSGIGPGGAVADLPVGRAFSDHPEWLIDTGWVAAGGHPVLETVLVVDGLEIRPYTTGFGERHTAIGVALMSPRSRGRLTLASADPAVPPRIEHRYDSEPADVADLARGADRVADLLAGVTDLGPPRWSTSQHLCGTAPMGAVVDPQCRVLGVDGLWVIDGSVLPRVPGRGPHATIAVLAHRAAAFV